MKELEEIKNEIEKRIEEMRNFKHKNFTLMKNDEFASAVVDIAYNLISAKTKLKDLIKYMSEGVSEPIYQAEE